MAMMTNLVQHERFTKSWNNRWAEVKRRADVQVAEHVGELIVAVEALGGQDELLGRLVEAQDIFERAGRGEPVTGWRGSLAQRNWARQVIQAAQELVPDVVIG